MTARAKIASTAHLLMPPLPAARAFGQMAGLVFVVVALLPLRNGNAVDYRSLAIAAALLGLARLWPSLLVWPCRVWLAFGSLLHHIISPVLVGVLFFFVFTPGAVLLRAAGRRPLALRRDADARTYWIGREQPAPAKDSMKFGF